MRSVFSHKCIFKTHKKNQLPQIRGRIYLTIKKNIMDKEAASETESDYKADKQ
ncbi:hypothetical protein GFK82_00110 [Candidatus Steffania adelgidicola]|nr:hypothetical protein GFK82_00110 [Candidatus Steffania adelgidicola]